MKPKKQTVRTARPDALAVALKAAPDMRPPPTKRELLRATAQVLYAERLKEFDAAHQELQKAKDALEQKAITAAKAAKADKWAFDEGWRNDPLKVHCTFEFSKEKGPLAEEYKKLKAMRVPGPPCKETIFRSLLLAANTQQARVDEILRDPAIAAKLLKAGQALLSQPPKGPTIEATAIS